MVRKMMLSAAMAVTIMGYASAASARDYISIVGSSTVYPFATVVAERLARRRISRLRRLSRLAPAAG